MDIGEGGGVGKVIEEFVFIVVFVGGGVGGDCGVGGVGVVGLGGGTT